MLGTGSSMWDNICKAIGLVPGALHVIFCYQCLHNSKYIYIACLFYICNKCLDCHLEYFLIHARTFKKKFLFPGWCGSVDWVPLACEPKGCWFDSQSGHMPGLWARSLVGGMQEATDGCFSRTLMFFYLFLPPFSSLKINKIFKNKINNKKFSLKMIRKQTWNSWLAQDPSHLSVTAGTTCLEPFWWFWILRSFQSRTRLQPCLHHHHRVCAIHCQRHLITSETLLNRAADIENDFNMCLWKFIKLHNYGFYMFSCHNSDRVRGGWVEN